MMDAWIRDPQNHIQDKDRPMLELYSQLTEDELVYVHELQKCYDEARCYFVQWILSNETKELVNSARISAVQAGNPFAWRQCREEILKSLTDVTLTARFLALSRLRRKQGSSAKLWVSQVLTRRALLEDPQLPTPITLPETLYLELTLGQMPRRLLKPPSLTSLPSATTCREKMGMGSPGIQWQGLNAPWMLAPTHPNSEVPKPLSPVYWTPRIKANANQTPMERNERRNALQSRQNTARDLRPAHEKQTKFPPGLKRPDPTSTVEGRKFSNDAQRQLFDDIKAGRCTRCHKDSHHRAKCAARFPLRNGRKSLIVRKASTGNQY
jgi:hypothetical protein